MRTRQHGLALALVLAALGAGFGIPQAALAGPRIEFETTTRDFGTMYQDQQVSTRFAFRNTGDETLVINSVTSSCGCTAVVPSPRQIAPGGSGSLQVTFASGRMRDQVTKYIYVDTNDALEQRTVLTITAHIRVEAEAVPAGIFVGTLKVGQTVTRSFAIRPVEVKRFRIVEVKSQSGLVRVSPPRRLGDKQGGYEITVRFGPVPKAQRVMTSVLVRTDLPHTKEFRVPVYGKVVEQESQRK